MNRLDIFEDEAGNRFLLITLEAYRYQGISMQEPHERKWFNKEHSVVGNLAEDWVMVPVKVQGTISTVIIPQIVQPERTLARYTDWYQAGGALYINPKTVQLRKGSVLNVIDRKGRKTVRVRSVMTLRQRKEPKKQVREQPDDLDWILTNDDD